MTAPRREVYLLVPHEPHTAAPERPAPINATIVHADTFSCRRSRHRTAVSCTGAWSRCPDHVR